MEILDRRITEYKDGSRVGIIDFKGKHSLSLLKVILMKVHNIGYTIDSVRGRQYDYYDDDGYKHHGQSRINNLTASDDFETGIDELLVSLYGDIRLFWHRCGSITSTFPYADREKPPLRILRFGNGIFRSEQYRMTM